MPQPAEAAPSAPVSVPAPDVATVTVLMPVRNEEAFIEQSLGSVLEQPVDKTRIEVLVLDGQSDDQTRELVALTAQRHGYAMAQRSPGDGFCGGTVAIVDNPGRIVPTGFNLGLAIAAGDVIVRVDGHCELEPDYLARVLEVLAQTGAGCVGGVLDTVALTPEAAALAVAVSSRIGVGNVAFRVGQAQAGPVDSLPFGAWPRGVFEVVGGFDEELVRNQDDEHAFRLMQAGYTVWFDPSIRSKYFSRTTIRRLAKQYFGYGLYKVRVAQKRGGLTSVRHLVPATFVAGLAGAVVLGVVRRDVRVPLLVIGPYVGLVGAESVRLGRERHVDPRTVASAIGVVHTSYGAGFLAGLWRFRRHHRQFVAAWRGQRRGPGTA